MKRFLLQLLSFVLPFAMVVAGVNYLGDAANVFAEGYEAAIAELMLQEQNLTRLSEYNDRQLQIELVSRRTAAPDVVVMGSSRTLLLNEAHFHPSSFFNHSMYAAAWYDLKRMYAFLETHDQLPDTLIVGLDPWTFNPNHLHAYTHTWKSYDPSFDDKAAVNLKTAWQRWSTLVSPSYFQASSKEFVQKLRDEQRPLPVKLRYNAGRTRCYDGSLTYDAVFGSTDSIEVLDRVQLFLRGPLYGMQDYTTTDELGFLAMQELVNNAHQRGIHVVVFFAPVAPPVYKRLVNEYPIALLNEQRFGEWARNNGFEVRGSFNPHEDGLGILHFYDGIHPNEEGIEVFFKTRRQE